MASSSSASSTKTTTIAAATTTKASKRNINNNEEVQHESIIKLSKPIPIEINKKGVIDSLLVPHMNKYNELELKIAFLPTNENNNNNLDDNDRNEISNKPKYLNTFQSIPMLNNDNNDSKILPIKLLAWPIINKNNNNNESDLLRSINIAIISHDGYLTVQECSIYRNFTTATSQFSLWKNKKKKIFNYQQ